MNAKNRLAVGVIAIAGIVAHGVAHADITLNATIRDFTPATNPDFEAPILGLKTGLVKPTLAADKNPDYTGIGGGSISSTTTFDQWYEDVSGVNISIPTTLTLAGPSNPGMVYKFADSNYFPIDGMGFGNYGNSGHNYHFTLELHTNFTYQAGQTFNFTGDDDVWVFINKQLVVDLGGIHGAVSGGVNLDTLMLTAGNTYDFDFFFAERHTTQSNLKIETSIVFNPNPDPLPEPATLALLGLGLAGLGFSRRKQ